MSVDSLRSLGTDSYPSKRTLCSTRAEFTLHESKGTESVETRLKEVYDRLEPNETALLRVSITPERAISYLRSIKSPKCSYFVDKFYGRALMKKGKWLSIRDGEDLVFYWKDEYTARNGQRMELAKEVSYDVTCSPTKENVLEPQDEDMKKAWETYKNDPQIRVPTKRYSVGKNGKIRLDFIGFFERNYSTGGFQTGTFCSCSIELTKILEVDLENINSLQKHRVSVYSAQPDTWNESKLFTHSLMTNSELWKELFASETDKEFDALKKNLSKYYLVRNSADQTKDTKLEEEYESFLGLVNAMERRFLEWESEDEEDEEDDEEEL